MARGQTRNTEMPKRTFLDRYLCTAISPLDPTDLQLPPPISQNTWHS